MVISQDGLKKASGIYYTNKFKNVLWTSEIDREIPIKCPDYPQTHTEIEKISNDSLNRYRPNIWRDGSF